MSDDLPKSAPLIEPIRRSMGKVFADLDSRPYIGEAERREFDHYRLRLEEQLDRIQAKVEAGTLRPPRVEGLPSPASYAGPVARVGIFIGSFDPFQMTHLDAALRLLASPETEVDCVYVVPEGSFNAQKPLKSEYRFRYDFMRLQVEEVWRPLVLPLDIGEGLDTIGIVNALIALHSGMDLKLTHLLGSDVLPVATRLLAPDLEIWNAEAVRSGCRLDHGIHVQRRTPDHDMASYGRQVRDLGCRFTADEEVMATPSSTDFRDSRHITIVFPTDELLDRLELLFRYRMHKSWINEDTN